MSQIENFPTIYMKGLSETKYGREVSWYLFEIYGGEINE